MSANPQPFLDFEKTHGMSFIDSGGRGWLRSRAAVGWQGFACEPRSVAARLGPARDLPISTERPTVLGMDYRGRRHRRRSFDEPGHAHELTCSCYRRFRFLEAERTCRWLARSIDDARGRWDFDLW